MRGPQNAVETSARRVCHISPVMSWTALCILNKLEPDLSGEFASVRCWSNIRIIPTSQETRCKLKVF
jgi:hypothetical protein